MKIDKTIPDTIHLRCFILAFCALLFLSCSSSHESSDSEGALPVKFIYHGDADNSQTQTEKLNCEQEGIATIEAEVFAPNGTLLANQTWKCEAHEGTIQSVAAGKDRSVVILGRDDKDNIIFRGERSSITVIANKPNRTEIIPCFSFIPRLQTPKNQATVPARAVPALKWNDLQGATDYRVIVSKNNDLSEPDINETTQKTLFSLSGQLSKNQTYYWQVIAIDAKAKEGKGSDIWSITVGSTFLSPVATGDNHTLAIKPDGTLWSWGRNVYGQLGIDDSGEETVHTSPIQVGDETDWVHVAAGHNHSVAIKTNGTMWSWGNNEHHELGLGRKDYWISTPTPVGKESDWVFVSAGAYHSVALKHDGEMWAWGSNASGQLGRGDKDGSQSKPTYIEGDYWAFVAASASHTMAINRKGYLWAWGSNDYGQLGIGDKEIRISPDQVDSASDWEFVSTSGSHSIGIKTSGELWGWGSNSFGQLGYDGPSQLKPQRIGLEEDWIYAVAAEGYTIGVKQNGEIWAWGRNAYGQLGSGDTANHTSAVKAVFENCVFVSSYSSHTAAVNSDGEVWCWGKNTYGQIGNAEKGEKSRPKEVNGQRDWDMIATGTSNYHTIVQTTNGQLWAWGKDEYGQLGIGGDITQHQKPMRIDADGQWISVAVGGTQTAAIKRADAGNGHTLWAWGSGYIGNGTSDTERTPIKIVNEQGWETVSCGYDFTLAIKSTGIDADPKRTLWSWGKNANGQLGLGNSGTGTERNKPTQIGTDTNWSHVTAGAAHALAIKSDGTLWSWGYNYYGQLGHGNKDDTLLTLTRIGTAADNEWESVSAGTNHTVAIKTDGTMWSWGINDKYQLGREIKKDGADSQTKPGLVNMEGNTMWRSVVAGNNHTVAIKTDDTLWGWGANHYGQLGEENLGSYTLSPTQIGKDGGWKSIAAGVDYTVAIKHDGSCWSWGDNTYGQLGDGSAWIIQPVYVTLD